MRVTDGMLFRQINRNVRVAKNRHADTYEMAQTGVRVSHPPMTQFQPQSLSSFKN